MHYSIDTRRNCLKMVRMTGTYATSPDGKVKLLLLSRGEMDYYEKRGAEEILGLKCVELSFEELRLVVPDTVPPALPTEVYRRFIMLKLGALDA